MSYHNFSQCKFQIPIPVLCVKLRIQKYTVYKTSCEKMLYALLIFLNYTFGKISKYSVLSLSRAFFFCLGRRGGTFLCTGKLGGKVGQKLGGPWHQSDCLKFLPSSPYLVSPSGVYVFYFTFRAGTKMGLLALEPTWTGA